MEFLKNNAMGISALGSFALGVAFAFTHLTAAQASACVSGPSVVGNFLANMWLRNGRKNGA